MDSPAGILNRKGLESWYMPPEDTMPAVLSHWLPLWITQKAFI
jgi:hypothetical protein